MQYSVLIGCGVRTTVDRFRGDFLLEYVGELITGEEGEWREDQEPSNFRFFFDFKGQEWW